HLTGPWCRTTHARLTSAGKLVSLSAFPSSVHTTYDLFWPLTVPVIATACSTSRSLLLNTPGAAVAASGAPTAPLAVTPSGNETPHTRLFFSFVIPPYDFFGALSRMRGSADGVDGAESGSVDAVENLQTTLALRKR